MKKTNVCKLCNKSLGMHSAMGLYCPTKHYGEYSTNPWFEENKTFKSEAAFEMDHIDHTNC